MIAATLRPLAGIANQSLFNTLRQLRPKKDDSMIALLSAGFRDYYDMNTWTEIFCLKESETDYRIFVDVSWKFPNSFPFADEASARLCFAELLKQFTDGSRPWVRYDDPVWQCDSPKISLDPAKEPNPT